MYGPRWATKPPPGTPIDWGHSLAQGLMGLYLCNEATGPMLHDSCGNLDLTAGGFGANQPWGVGPSGNGIVTSGYGTVGYQAPIPPQLRLNYPISIACAVRIVGTVSNSGRIFGLMPVNSATAPFFSACIYASSSTSVSGAIQRGGAGTSSAAFAITQGVDYVFSLTAGTAGVAGGSSGYAFYANGSPAGGDSAANGGQTWTSGAQLLLSGWTSVAGNSACAPIYWGAWWDRALSADEHARIGSSPASIYRLLAPRYAATRERLAPAGVPRLSYPRGRSVLAPHALTNADYVGSRYGD